MKLVTIFGILVFFSFLFFFFPKKSFASEGRFSLQGKVNCEGVSIWRQSSYQILDRCNGLSYPYSDQLDEYVLWSQPVDSSSPQIISSIQRGIIEGNTTKRFSRLFITAENSASPQTPSSIEIASGGIQSFNFQEPTLVEKTSIPIPKTSSPKPFVGFKLGSALPLKSLFLFILVIVVLLVIIFRPR